MATALEHVARIVEGTVLVDDAGMLPSFTSERDDLHLREALALTAAEIPIAPTAQLPDGRLVHFVGTRAGAPARAVSGAESGAQPDARPGALPGTFVPPSALADPELAAVVARAIAERDPARTPAARPDWFRPGWFDRIEAWIDGALAPSGRRRTGPVEAFKAWSMSAVVRVPTDSGALWLKAPSDLFRAEARIHPAVARLLPELVPRLVAVEEAEGWVLMEPMTGAEDEDRAEGAALEVAARWAAAQIAGIAHVPALLAAGLPHRGAEQTVSAFRKVLESSGELALLSAEELAEIRASADRAEALVRELWALGIPDTLAHGDLHLGNVAWDGTVLQIFDWTDGCVSHPFLDASHLSRFVESRAAAGAQAAYAEPWRAAFPHADIDRAVALAPLVDLVFQAVTFDAIAEVTEAQSAWELRGVVARLLRALPGRVAELG